MPRSVSTREGNHQVALSAGTSANLRLEQPRTESKWESIHHAGYEDGLLSPRHQKRRKRSHHFVLDTGKESCPGGACPFTATAPHRQKDPHEKSQHRARACRVDGEILGDHRSGSEMHQRFSGTRPARWSKHAGPPAAVSVIASFDNSIGLPAPVAKPSEPVIFKSMISKWAKLTNAPKKGIQNMETKSGRFRRLAWSR